ncbi:MAG TPA: hypothetical protein VFA39_15775 [Steroidobacteraceae bacterium]|nr:hypothetical protein [Steroidobacteraceae bacterium]
MFGDGDLWNEAGHVLQRECCANCGWYKFTESDDSVLYHEPDKRSLAWIKSQPNTRKDDMEQTLQEIALNFIKRVEYSTPGELEHLYIMLRTYEHDVGRKSSMRHFAAKLKGILPFQTEAVLLGLNHYKPT